MSKMALCFQTFLAVLSAVTPFLSNLCIFYAKPVNLLFVDHTEPGSRDDERTRCALRAHTEQPSGERIGGTCEQPPLNILFSKRKQTQFQARGVKENYVFASFLAEMIGLGFGSFAVFLLFIGLSRNQALLLIPHIVVQVRSEQ
ncbi:hypothetical protein ANCCEY_10301 [Ancylostoma ceylanicum]|uniref:Uncharacterized protein n=1 Tax=Ancylostoma ceylanicum TaxID=53326 RepID=A0A0D6LF69_9BILA|nr:hypothetical protein ANCCEY_10301 [Ancylostoma ceylanicum]